MRFRRLRLIAFGHFTNVDIELGELPALHVLYGPNEAGKSTALRAITGLLYGIPLTTNDAHLHRMPDLRVGAVLSLNGSELDVVRRKGSTNTLVDATSGEQLPEVSFRAMLGGVDEATFRAMFGLDHDSLRQGAEALLRGGGSVGESLFDAGLSGRGIQSVLSELRKEADELYRPRGQRQSINEALRRFKEAKDHRSSDSVRPDAWVSQVEELDRTRRRSGLVSERRRSLVAEQNALQRALRVLPMLAKRRGLLEGRAALRDAVRLDPGAVAAREGAQRAIEQISRDAGRLGDEIAERELQLASLQVPDALAKLDSEVIEEIYGRLGEHRKAATDLPKRAAELKVRDGEVKRLAVAVGHDAGPVDPEKVQVGVRVQAAVRRLATHRAALDASAGDLRRRLAQREADLEELQSRAELTPRPPDCTALRSALDDARLVADLPARVEALQVEIAALEKSVEDGLGQLAPWRGDAAELGRVALPSLGTIDRFARELDALAAARTEVSRRRRDLEGKQAANRRELRAHDEIGAPPSEHDLRRARDLRDELWRRIRQGGVAVSAEDGAAFDRALSDADEIADRLRREADRVAAAAALRANAAYLDEEMRGVAAEEKENTSRAEALASQWSRLWELAGVAPRQVAEMRDWLARSAEVLGNAARLRELTGERERANARIGERRAALAAQMTAAAGEVTSDVELGDLLRSARQLCDRLESAQRNHEGTQQSLAALAAEIGRERRALSEQEQHIEQWGKEWQVCVGALGLAGDVSTEEALAVLEALLELSAKVEEMAAIRARVAGIELDVGDFRKDVAKLVGVAAPELAQLDPAEAAERLVRMHRRAMIDLESRRRIEGEVAERRHELRHLDTERESREVELQSLFAAACVSDLDSLLVAEERSASASTIDGALAEIERELLAAGEGADIEQLVAQTAGIDADGARARLYELASEIEGLTDEVDRLGRDIGSKESGLAALENERGAAAAAADEQESLADLSAHVRCYVRVKLAAEILESEVERYRQQNQGPILTRANAYFPRLTLGSYSELRVGYNAKDEEVLRCVRAGGVEVDVDALSDGTRDQLYLALRLATVEHFAAGHEPLPLVLDDVLIHFDDDRAKAALEVLGTFASTTQILFFTHHARLVELARQVVPDERRVEHDLSTLGAVISDGVA